MRKRSDRDGCQRSEGLVGDQARYLEAFFQHSISPLAILGPDFDFIRVNQAYARACRRKAEEFPGRNHFEFYPHPENQAIFEQVVRSKTAFVTAAKPFVFPEHPEWGVTYWDWALVPILDAGDRVEFLVFSLNDVTNRKLAEEEVRKASLYARSLIEASLDPLVLINSDGRIADVNQATEMVTGVDRARLIGSAFSDYFTEREKADEVYHRAIREGRVNDYPLTIRHISGHITDVLCNASPYRNEQGEGDGILAAAHDITERVEMERILKKSEARYRSLVTATAQIVWTTNALGEVVEDIPTWRAFTGQNAEEILGRGWADAVHPEDRRRTEAAWQCSVETRTIYETECRIRTRAGEYRHFSVRGVPVLDEDGSIREWIGTCTDITESKRKDAELRLASLYARSLIDASLDPLVTISPDGKITDVNKATEDVTGVSRERLIGSDFADYFTEPEKASAGYQMVIAMGQTRDYPLTIRHASGQTTDVLYNATVYRNEAGQAQGVFAAARDVTEIRAAEKRREFTNTLLELFAANESSQEYLDSVAGVIQSWSNCSALGIRVAEEDGQIPYVSSIGLPREFLEAESPLHLTRDNCTCTRAVTQQFEEQDLAIVTPGGSFRLDNASEFLGTLPSEKRTRYRGRCAQSGFSSLAVVPIRYREQVLGAVHLADPKPNFFTPSMLEVLESIAPLIGEAVHRFRAEAELNRYRNRLEELVAQRTAELQTANNQLQMEIAERRRAEQSLRSVAEELARSNRDLEQFAYVASHDLQEPLRAVAGFVQLLDRRFPERLDDRSRQYVAGAVDGVTRMQRLIGDLLQFSRVGSQRGSFRFGNLDDSLRDALSILRAGIEDSKAKITSDPLPELYADFRQMTQLFQNLIGNAIKFHGDRLPEIHIRAERREGFWLLSVRDNGIGIDPRYGERIFLIFQRLHTRSRYPGTGIGLAICKKIVERHRGSIWVESQLGEGSTFYFTVPNGEQTQ